MRDKCRARGVGDDGTDVYCALPFPHTGGHWHPKKQRWPLTRAEQDRLNPRPGRIPGWAVDWLLVFIVPLLLPALVLVLFVAWILGVVWAVDALVN